MQTIIEKKQSGFEMDVCMCTYSEAREPERQSTLILIYVSQTSTEMEQSGIEVGVRAIRKWWESACRENRPFVILCENANKHREEAKRNRGGRVHALIAKHESQSTLILIYVS